MVVAWKDWLISTTNGVEAKLWVRILPVKSAWLTSLIIRILWSICIAVGNQVAEIPFPYQQQLPMSIILLILLGHDIKNKSNSCWFSLVSMMHHTLYLMLYNILAWYHICRICRIFMNYFKDFWCPLTMFCN